MKKIFLFTLILIIGLSALNIAYADNFPDISSDKALVNAVGVLSSYDIIDGYPDGMFKPYRTVTRAEMSKILIVTAGYSEYSKNMTSVYEDMKGHWAENYVELAKVLKISNGLTPNHFGPDNVIKFHEAYTMILRSLGYRDESLRGEWPKNYFDKALELGIFENVDTSVEYVTRRDVSIMLYNALHLNLVKIKDDNSVALTDKTLLSALGRKEVKEVTLNDLKNENFNYSLYLFNIWDFYYNLEGKIVEIGNPRYEQFRGKITSLLSNRVLFVTDDFGNVRVFQTPDVPIIINGEYGTFGELDDCIATIVCEDKSFNGEVVGITALKETKTMIVDKNNLYKKSSNMFGNKYLPINSNSQINLNKLNIIGDALSLEDIKIDDVVYIYGGDSPNTNALTIKVVRKEVSGSISEIQKINNETIYVVNKKGYKINEKFDLPKKPIVNDVVKLILDKDGKIAKLYITDYGKSPSTFGLVLSTANSTSGYVTARILDETGGLRNYSLADNSGVVNIVELDAGEQKISKIRKNDIVLFDPVTNGSVKIIDLMNTKSISHAFDKQDNKFANGYFITDETFMIYETNGKYQIVRPRQLDTYVEGKVVVNSRGYISAMLISKGIVSLNSVTVGEIPQSFNGTIYDMVKSVEKIDDSTSHVKFFNNPTTFSISNISPQGAKLSSVMNSYVKAVIVNGYINSIERVTPETDRIKITQVYSNQLLIDDITYMEYSSDLKVYICTIDAQNNVIQFSRGTKTDIKAGMSAQLYDMHGSFDGIIDMVLIFSKE